MGTDLPMPTRLVTKTGDVSMNSPLQDGLNRALEGLNEAKDALDEMVWDITDELAEIPEDERKGDNYENFEALLEAVENAANYADYAQDATADADTYADRMGKLG